MSFKGILTEVSGLKVLEIYLFQHPPHTPDSTNINQPPSLLWRRFIKGKFTILEEGPATYRNTCLFPVTLLGTVTAKWAKQIFKWGRMQVAIKTVKQLIDLLHKHTSCNSQHQSSLKQT